MLSNISSRDANVGAFPPNQLLNRSCESCRTLKVRCLPSASSSTQCQRCAKASRECIFVAPQRKKARKRTDTRVAELEKEVRAMRSLLKAKRSSKVKGEEGDSSEDDDEESSKQASPADGGEESSIVVDTNRSLAPDSLNNGQSVSESSNTQANPVNAPFTSSGIGAGFYYAETDDVIDRELITLSTATELFNVFTTQLVHYFPVPFVPESMSFAQFRGSRPILFLAAIAAAAITIDDSLAKALTDELRRVFADRLIIRAEKSIEMIQALLVTIIFSYPPGPPSRVQYFQYTGMATTMTLELGLASKPRSQVSSTIRDKDGADTMDGMLLERSRTLLTCYFLASSVALTMRRPTMLINNGWMTQSWQRLRDSSSIFDKKLAALAGLRQIIDHVSTSFGFEEDSSSTNVSDPRVQAILKWFEKSTDDWNRKHGPDVMDVSLQIEYQAMKLAVYELALSDYHRDVDAVKRRHFILPALDDNAESRRLAVPMTAARVDTTMKDLAAAHASLDIFLGLDTASLRQLPNILFARCLFSLLTLLKFFFAATSGSLGEFVDAQSLEVDRYLHTMIRRLAEASGDRKYRVPTHWLQVITNSAKDWYDQFQLRLRQTKMQSTNNTQADPTLQGISSSPKGNMAQASYLPLQTPNPNTAMDIPITDQGFTALDQTEGFQDSFIPMDTTGFPVDFNNLFFGADPGGWGGWLPDESMFGFPGT